MLNSSFIQTLLSFLSAALGASIAARMSVSHKRLCAMISFAAGSLLAITFFHIMPETFQALPSGRAVIAVFSGYFLFYLISRFVFHVCPACAASHLEKHTLHNFKNSAILLAIALGIHSTLDGMAIALDHDVKARGAYSLFLAVLVHKLPEGLALCALLLKGGLTKTRALLLSLLFESATLAGWAMVRFGFHGTENVWIDYLLAHIGGGFLYLGLHALINESRDHSPRFVIPFFLIGMTFVGLAEHFFG